MRVVTDERLVIVGATGTGKTTLVRRVLLPVVPPGQTVIVIDPKRDRNWQTMPDTPRRGPKPGSRSAFRWGGGRDGDVTDLADAPAFDRMLRRAWSDGNTLLICDETSALFPAPHTMTPLMGRIIREGRQRNVGIWWLIQRPAGCPAIILSEAESWAVFTLRRKLDRDTAAGYVGDEVRAIPPQEGDRSHIFWWSRPGMNSPELKRIRLTNSQKVAS